MRAYYNEIDGFCCDWLSNLMDAGQITPGTIDDRDIREVQPADVAGFDRVHLFAGVAGWDLALEFAGWGPGPVWTASCPCPPFSQAGKRRTCPECESAVLVWCPRRTGYAICAECSHSWLADERHLWPEAWRLAAECHPRRIFGEQVAGPGGLDWLAGVRGSMEILGYFVGAQDLPAAGLGAPQLRQRLWWVADADGWDASSERIQRGREHGLEPEDCGASGGLAESHSEHWGTGAGRKDRTEAGDSGGLADSEGRTTRCGHHVREGEPYAGEGGGLGDTEGNGLQEPVESHEGRIVGSNASEDGGLGQSDSPGRVAGKSSPETARQGDPSFAAGGWESAVLIQCRDGKWRQTPDPESGILPLASGVPCRVGRLRAYGNAIVPQVAAAFIMAHMETASA